MTVATDGCLPAALDRLYAAVAALIDPCKELVDGALMSGPSVYEQLVGAIPAAASNSMAFAHSQARSKSPVWTDAMDLRIEIDGAIQAWRPDRRSIVHGCEQSLVSSTPSRLRALAAGKYRPQDTRQLEQIAANLEAWVVEIKALLVPQHVKHLSVACPACNATHVYRRDSTGERVRQPALQIVADQGCTCQACKHNWLPQHYLLLCRVLGFDLPEGVVG